VASQNLHRLADQAKNAIRQLHDIPFDPMGWGRLYPQFDLHNQLERVWRERWISRLVELSKNDCNITQELVDFIAWALYVTELPPIPIVPTLERILPNPQQYIDWESAENLYSQHKSEPNMTYQMWPLTAGGWVLEGEPFCLGDEVWFVPGRVSKIVPSRVVPQVVQYLPGHIARLYPDFLPQPNFAIGAWLIALVPITLVDRNSEAVWTMGDEYCNRMFLSLLALKLAAEGNVSSPYGIFVDDPLYFSKPPVVYMDPPSDAGSAARHLHRWPPGDIDAALGEADYVYRLLRKLPGIFQMRTPNITMEVQGISLIRRNPTPDTMIPISFLDFALQLFDLTYARDLHEIVIYSWAILEGLLLTDNDRTESAHNVAVRMVALMVPGGNVAEQEDAYNRTRLLATARNALAHGRAKSPRSITPREVWEYHAWVRQAILQVLKWVANNTVQQDRLIDYLTRVPLRKSPKDFKRDWKTTP
jgi:hypothetical protein